jgi:hypothetical protein
MVYRNLIGKRIGLTGTDKICADIQEFFYELTYEKVRVVEDIYLRYKDFDGCEYYWLGTEKSASTMVYLKA